MVHDNPTPPEGKSFFFTLRLADRQSDLLLQRLADLRCVIRDVKILRPFRIDAITVLPAAMHTLWTLPPRDTDPDRRLALIMSRFAQLQRRGDARPQPEPRALWQRRPWRHAIADRADFLRHRDLIYLSPVQEGLCATPQDWLHTSLHRDLKDGLPVLPPGAMFPAAPPALAEF